MSTENKETANVCCPHCSKEIDVDQILYQKVELKTRNEYDAKFKELEDAKLNIAESMLRNEADLQKKYEKLYEEKESELKKKLENQSSESFASMQKELDDQNEKLKEYNSLKSEVLKLQRKNDNMRTEIELELNESLNREREKIAKKEYEKFELKFSESQKIIDDLSKQLSEAQRRAEQGSVQLQGEVQELAIEDWLKSNFSLDIINGVKNGKRGADCLQKINTYTVENCGTIYYESKRTKEFQASWISKFKDDMREQNANIGVLVTDVLPKGHERMTQIDGIWVCTYSEFKSLCFVLRQQIIQISAVLNAQENKGDKMVMLYDYLVSETFRNHIETIITAFIELKEELDGEKRSMQGIWKRREIRIEKVLTGTNYMYNSIKGIAGNVIKPIQQLELPTENLN